MRRETYTEATDWLPALGVAAVLAGAWRPVPPPLSLAPEAVAAAVPLLLQSTAAPLAWRRLRLSGLHNSRVARPLHTAYREFAIESAGHEQHLQEVLPLLRAAGVEPILVKGWSVARLYPQTGLRPYCDLDLCVRHDQVKTAMGVLSQAARRELMVELHQGIPDLKDRAWADAYRRSRLVRLGDVDVRVLCSEDQLRLSCLHMMRHGCGAPLWLCDLGAALESRPADFDWDYCLHGHRARSAWVVCWLGLARRLLGARFDEPSLSSRADDLPPWLAPAVLERWTRPVRDWRTLDPIKSAYRRRLRPHHSLPVTQMLGLAGRLVEAPSRLWRQVRRWRRRTAQPFELHDEAGA
jgi:hypothetical protein